MKVIETFFSLLHFTAYHDKSWGTRIYHERSWRLLKYIWSFMMYHDLLYHNRLWENPSYFHPWYFMLGMHGISAMNICDINFWLEIWHWHLTTQMNFMDFHWKNVVFILDHFVWVVVIHGNKAFCPHQGYLLWSPTDGFLSFRILKSTSQKWVSHKYDCVANVEALIASC